MSRSPLGPVKPAAITLDTLPQLFAANKARFGGWQMQLATDPPARPDGITEEVWTVLGEPGKAALVAERAARQKAEHALAAAHARPAPPKGTPTAPAAGGESAPATDTGTPDLAKLVADAVADAVAAAVAPITEAAEKRAAAEAAGKVRAAVVAAAADVLHNGEDILLGLDLAAIVGADGQPDPAKLAAAIGDVAKAKPYLVRDPRRFAPDHAGAAGAGGGQSEADKVTASLGRMQTATGIKPKA